MTGLNVEKKIWQDHLDFWRKRKTDLHSVTHEVKSAMIKYCEDQIEKLNEKSILS